MTTKEAFLKEKLANFTKFVKVNIGEENSIYADLKGYENNFNGFLKDIIELAKFAKQNGENWIFENKDISKFLEFKGVTKKITEEIVTKINKYFSMFLKVLSI